MKHELETIRSRQDRRIKWHVMKDGESRARGLGSHRLQG